MDRRVHVLRSLTLALALQGLAGVAHAGLLDRITPDEGIPSAEEAFVMDAPLWDGKELSLRWHIAPGCYLYRDKLSAEGIAPEGYTLGLASLPLGESLRDPHFGTVAIFRDEVTARFRPKSGVPPKTLRVRFQGCAENKVCYPPQTRIIEVPAR